MTTTKQREANKWSNISLRVLVNTLSHPFEYAKVLIQVFQNFDVIFRPEEWHFYNILSF